METETASTTSSKSNKLTNVNTTYLTYNWSLGTLPPNQVYFDNRKSENIAFVVNAVTNVHANNF